MKLKLYGAVALILCLSFLKAPAQNGISPELAKELESSLFDLQVLNKVKGISAAVYFPGKGVWKGVSGLSHGSVPVDTNMLFAMGSNTKTVIAAEILKMVDAGQLSLDDTIGSLLPPIEHVFPSISIRHLLGMKSGLADYMTNEWNTAMVKEPSRIWGVREAIDSFLTEQLAYPGEEFAYNNANYALLGLIIEAKKNDVLHKILRNDLLTPLGLKNTYMIVENFPNTIVHNWKMLNTGVQDVSNIPKQAIWTSLAPVRGLFSTPEDLVHFGYNLYSGKVISQASLNEMLTFTENSLNPNFTGYGLGTMRITDNGHTYWGHNGNVDGFLSIMMFDPVDSVCVALMVNQWSNVNIYTLGKAFMNSVRANLTTSVSDITGEENLSITPNPAFNEITFLNNTGSCALKIINNLGETVYSGTLDSPRMTINTSEFANGLYFALLTSSSGTITKKIFIQR
ncbi:MAG: serine hydrolase [Bacteroidota bacterium]